VGHRRGVKFGSPVCQDKRSVKGSLGGEPVESSAKYSELLLDSLRKADLVPARLCKQPGLRFSPTDALSH